MGFKVETILRPRTKVCINLSEDLLEKVDGIIKDRTGAKPKDGGPTLRNYRSEVISKMIEFALENAE